MSSSPPLARVMRGKLGQWHIAAVDHESMEASINSTGPVWEVYPAESPRRETISLRQVSNGIQP